MPDLLGKKCAEVIQLCNVERFRIEHADSIRAKVHDELLPDLSAQERVLIRRLQNGFVIFLKD